MSFSTICNILFIVLVIICIIKIFRWKNRFSEESLKKINIFKNFALQHNLIFIPTVSLFGNLSGESAMIQKNAYKTGIDKNESYSLKLVNEIFHSEFCAFRKNESHIDYILFRTEGSCSIYIFEHTQIYFGDVAPPTNTRETIACIISSKLNLPYFILEPRNILHNAAKIPGFNKISKLEEVNTIGSHKVTENYFLGAKDKEIVINFFRQDVISFLEKYKDISVEENKDTLIYYRKDRIEPLNNVLEFIKETVCFYNLFHSCPN